MTLWISMTPQIPGVFFFFFFGHCPSLSRQRILCHDRIPLLCTSGLVCRACLAWSIAHAWLPLSQHKTSQFSHTLSRHQIFCRDIKPLHHCQLCRNINLLAWPTMSRPGCAISRHDLHVKTQTQSRPRISGRDIGTSSHDQALS